MTKSLSSRITKMHVLSYGVGSIVIDNVEHYYIDANEVLKYMSFLQAGILGTKLGTKYIFSTEEALVLSYLNESFYKIVKRHLVMNREAVKMLIYQQYPVLVSSLHSF